MKNIEKIQKHKYLNGSVVQGKKSTELYIYIYIYIYKCWPWEEKENNESFSSICET
jgi:hypothetical protein